MGTEHADAAEGIRAAVSSHAPALAVDVAFTWLTWPAFAAALYVAVVAASMAADWLRITVGMAPVSCRAPAADLDLIGITCLFTVWPLLIAYPLFYAVVAALAAGQTVGMREYGTRFGDAASTAPERLARALLWGIATAIATVVSAPLAWLAVMQLAAPFTFIATLVLS